MYKKEWIRKLCYNGRKRDLEKNKNKKSDITEQYIKLLLEQQNSICGFCNNDLNLNNPPSLPGARGEEIKLDNPSLDEKKIGLGHNIGNVHITCLFCNLARNKNEYENFSNLIKVLLGEENKIDLSKDNYYKEKNHHNIDLMLKFKEKDETITQYTFEFLIQKLKKVNYKCEITGLPFFFGKDYHYLMPSFDRIDNSKPHTEDNIQLVCSFVNRGKNKHTNDELLDIINKIKKIEDIEEIEITYPEKYFEDCIIYNLQETVEKHQHKLKIENKMYKLLIFVKEYLNYCNQKKHKPKDSDCLGTRYYHYKNNKNKKEYLKTEFENIFIEFELEISNYISYNNNKINETFLNNLNNYINFYYKYKRFPEYNRDNQQEEKSLYDWFVNIKMAFNNGRCSEYEKNELLKNNFIKEKLNENIDTVWNKKYNDYENTVKKNNKHPGSNEWAQTQRKLFKQLHLSEKERKQGGKLDEERISLLEQIPGWYWSKTHKTYLENKDWFDNNPYIVPKKNKKIASDMSEKEKCENSIYSVFDRIKNNKIKNNQEINIFDEPYLVNIDIYYIYKYLTNDFSVESLKTKEGKRELYKKINNIIISIKNLKLKNFIKQWKKQLY